MIKFTYTPITALYSKKDKTTFISPVTNFPQDDLRQLLHQLQLSIMIAKHIEFKYFEDMQHPPQLQQHDLEDNPSYDECSIFIIVLDKLWQIISDNRVAISSQKESVFEMINVVVVVENNELTISYKDETFLNSVKQELINNDFKDVVIN